MSEDSSQMSCPRTPSAIGCSRAGWRAIAAALAIGSLAVPADAATLSVGSATATEGDIVQVPVSFSSVDPVGSIDVTIAYPSNLVGLFDVLTTDLADFCDIDVDVSAVSSVSVSLFCFDPIVGSGDVFVLDFDALAPGSGSLEPTACQLDAGGVPCTPAGGTITITPPSQCGDGDVDAVEQCDPLLPLGCPSGSGCTPAATDAECTCQASALPSSDAIRQALTDGVPDADSCLPYVQSVKVTAGTAAQVHLATDYGASGFPAAGTEFLILGGGDPFSPSNGDLDVGGDDTCQGDQAIVEITLDVPPGSVQAIGFTYDFFSFEYPEFVGSPYNDYVMGFLDAAPLSLNYSCDPSPGTGCLLTFDDLGNRTNVNSVFFRPCADIHCDAPPGTPGWEADPLEDAGRTGSLTTCAPLGCSSTPVAGRHTLTLIAGDAGDGFYSSVGLFDNLRCFRDLACPQVRTSRCGDGQLDSGESCDDGNRVNGDGCTSGCTREDQCLARPFGEACDDGDGCTGDDQCRRGTCVGTTELCRVDAKADEIEVPTRRPVLDVTLVAPPKSRYGAQLFEDAGQSAALVARAPDAAVATGQALSKRIPPKANKTKSIKASGTAKLRFKLNPVARDLLKRKGSVNAVVDVKLAEPGGKTRLLQRLIRLVRKSGG